MPTRSALPAKGRLRPALYPWIRGKREALEARLERAGKRVSMRALDCECGQHLEAESDEELFEQARTHVDRDHPEMQLGDEQVREIVSGGAYDK